MSQLYKSIIRPLLFSLPPEAAHRLGKAMLRYEWPWRLMRDRLHVRDERLRARLGGLQLSNPVGLAAGFDKNAEALRGLQHLGLGYLTVGSILPAPRPGNPKPRLIRYVDKESMLNCYGLPSDGLEACVRRLAALSRRQTPIIANIDAPTLPLYLRSFEAVEPHVDAVEIGIQCPNNQDDQGDFHEAVNFERLLAEVMQRRRKPVFVKILSYQDEAQRQNRLELAERAVRSGVDGITIPGSWRQQEPRLSIGYGHSSGRMLFRKTIETVRDLHSITRGRIAIKANGGIFTGEDAYEALAAGATSVELLTSFVYEGWDVATRINRELVSILARNRLPSVHGVRELVSA